MYVYYCRTYEKAVSGIIYLHTCMFIAIVCKVCALAIGTVGNRYFVARQDECQRRPGCIPAHQTQALQGVCTLASRLPTMKETFRKRS